MCPRSSRKRKTAEREEPLQHSLNRTTNMSQVRQLLSTDISCFEKTLDRCWETMCDAICLTSYWPSANPGRRWTNAATWGERGGRDWRKEQTWSVWASKEQDNSSNGGLRWGHANTSILNFNDLWKRMTIVSQRILTEICFGYILGSHINLLAESV